MLYYLDDFLIVQILKASYDANLDQWGHVENDIDVFALRNIIGQLMRAGAKPDAFIPLHLTVTANTTRGYPESELFISPIICQLRSVVCCRRFG